MTDKDKNIENNGIFIKISFFSTFQLIDSMFSYTERLASPMK